MTDITALMARRLRCSSCMRRFRPQDISTIESTARFGAFRLRCPLCLSERLVIAVWTKSAIRTFSTDLDYAEWNYYRQAPPINADDVIRMARIMSEYEGDFSDVLEDPMFDEK
ncbi:MAG: hypothetical protein EYC68_08990 [Chloroflexota bacterium]|nr:MAG: hypothetical protein EYC68_08990 [Chloroflexota bacterium]